MVEEVPVKKAFLIALAAVLLAGMAFAQLQIPLGEVPKSEPKQPKQQGRTLTGVVLGKEDAPLAQAVVYLKDTKTSGVKSFIAQDDGTYRFAGLSPYINYDVYAEYKGKKSGTKTLSTFDSRSNPKIVLRIDTSK